MPMWTVQESAVPFTTLTNHFVVLTKKLDRRLDSFMPYVPNVAWSRLCLKTLAVRGTRFVAEPNEDQAHLPMLYATLPRSGSYVTQRVVAGTLILAADMTVRFGYVREHFVNARASHWSQSATIMGSIL
jgi:hypothetical protein